MAAFGARKARAGLVQMPTGSGKTGVIATLARCETRIGPVVVIAPRVGVRAQLARHINDRFFEHANFDPGLLPRNVIELQDGRQQVGDLNHFGPQYDDSKMGVIGALNPVPALRNISSEKGERSRRNGAGWAQDSLFGVIDALGARTELELEFEGTRVLVCDDLRDESADFILVQDESTHHRRRVVFIHAKAKRQGSKIGRAHV